jgi:Lipase (class 3)
MRTSTDVHAALSADAYNTYPREKWREGVVVYGVRYEILDQVSRPSGYQGTMYRNTETGEMVVAHRGTEFDRELVRDGIVADGGMVVVGVNRQENDALAFTRHAVEIANDMNREQCQVSSLTVTGHSLGGTLAQITSYRLGLKGETFDAYGAAGLVADISEGGTQVINHVRSTDFVSAASAHYGEVRIYSPQQDIDALRDQGYANDRRVVTDLRNPLGVAFGIGIEAHYSRNFLPGNDLLGDSVVSQANRDRYAQHQPMVDKYRNDVALIHGTLALPRNVVDGVIDTARDIVRGRQPQVAPAPRFVAGQCALPAPDPNQPGHPDHAMYGQIRAGVHALDASVGRAPDAASDRLSASLLVQAKQHGLDRVDHVLRSVQTPQLSEGENIFAVQGALNDPGHLRTHVNTRAVLGVPVEESFRQVEALNQRQAEPQQARERSFDPPQQTATGFSR